jgi:hypothetical protein
MDLFPHLDRALAVLGLVASGVVCVLTAFSSHQAWLYALEHLASGRNTRLPGSIASTSLFFASTTPIINAIFLPFAIDDLAATALLIVTLLLTLANVLHSAYRVECIRVVSTDPRFESLEQVPHAGNRLEYIRREARALGLPRLRGAALQLTLVRAAVSLLVAGALYGMFTAGSGDL